MQLQRNIHITSTKDLTDFSRIKRNSLELNGIQQNSTKFSRIQQKLKKFRRIKHNATTEK